ncbi:SigE family RNA polymerase sigma factor [Granulicoccus phenolivorans]|uniref:SigE family RNA polymerase sigma factor n=1 Tax=Granulicoccus phenolivorans TaxID=266854 RepID=UPI00040232E3|nr:SigE family RNA polymerase sigma factor [Granulicoccus phenolivorans]
MGRAQTDEEYARFVRGSSARLLSIARALCQDAHQAEDLTQQTLEKAYLKWGRVRRADDPHRYVRRMLVNLHTDWMRRKPWRERAVPTTPGEVGPGAGYPEPVTADRTGRVATRDVVARALQGLTPREREVVALRFLEDLSEADTAAELGIAVGTVKSACNRALARLRSAGEIAELKEGR